MPDIGNHVPFDHENDATSSAAAVVADKVLLIGGGGYVGVNLARKLDLAGYDVYIMDEKQYTKDVLQYASYVGCDVLNLKAMQDIFAQISPIKCVIHLASTGMSGGKMMDYGTFKVNVHGTQNVINCCLSHETTSLIYISTYNVIFGGKPIENGDESMKPYPAEDHTDRYSGSKAVAEHMVLAANGSKLRTCALRPAAIYGAGEQRHIPRILRNIDSGMFCFRIGRATVDWVHVDNLTDCIVSATKKITEPKISPLYRPCGHAYFVSDGTPIDNFVFLKPLCESRLRSYPSFVIPHWALIPLAEMMENIYKTSVLFKFPIEPFMTRAELYKVGVTHYFSIDKARKDFGYAPKITSTDGARYLGKFYGPDGAGGKDRFNLYYFQFVPFFWWPLILSGMMILYYFAFHEYNVTTVWLKSIMDPLRNIAFSIFKNQTILRAVWRCALVAHFCEAMYAVNVCINIGSLKIGSWFVQTLLLGYPSLKLLLKRQSLGVHKNDANSNNQNNNEIEDNGKKMREMKQ